MSAIPPTVDPFPVKAPSNPRIVREDLPLLQAIISGGQTGADAAGLRAAAKLGLATGGYAPKDFKTLNGRNPQLGSLYGLIECWTPDYAYRTAKNVLAADATVRIAEDFESVGEICTLKAIEKYKKPWIDVDLSTNTVHLRENWLADQDVNGDGLFRAFLLRHNVRILNVAGNSEKSAPGIGQIAETFLLRALGRI